METAERPPVFPYWLFWEELGNVPPSFEKLVDEEQNFRLMFEITQDLGIPTPFVDETILERIVQSLALQPDSARRLIAESFLIAGWYLRPEHRTAMEIDLPSAQRALRHTLKASRELYDAINSIPPMMTAVMYYMRALEPDALDPLEDLNLLVLARTLYDLALVSERVITDSARKGAGRRKDYVRNSAISLAVEAVERATGAAVTTSRGTKVNPAPHFTSASGRFVRDLFKLLAPKIDERVFSQALDRIRRSEARESIRA